MSTLRRSSSSRRPSAPNFWLDATEAAYVHYADCFGYGFTSGSLAGLYGGMWTLTGPTLGTYANITVQDPGDQPYAPYISDTITHAGPDDDVPNWFFPAMVKQIHRTPICGGPVDPASQVQ